MPKKSIPDDCMPACISCAFYNCEPKDDLSYCYRYPPTLIEIEGNFEQHIKGHYSQTVNKTSTITSFGDMVISAGSTIAGTLEINTPDSVIFSADLAVACEVTCDKLTAAS